MGFSAGPTGSLLRQKKQCRDIAAFVFVFGLCCGLVVTFVIVAFQRCLSGQIFFELLLAFITTNFAMSRHSFCLLPFVFFFVTTKLWHVTINFFCPFA